MSKWTPRNKQGARCPHCEHMHQLVWLGSSVVKTERRTCEQCGQPFILETRTTVNYRTRPDWPKGPAPVARNPDRRKRHHLRMWGPPGFREWLLKHPCCICGAKATDMSHVKSRGAGNGAENNAVPQDHRCHLEYEAGKESFENRHNVDMQEMARRYWARWLQHSATEQGGN